MRKENKHRPLERTFEPMDRIRSDRQVTGMVLPLIANGALDYKPGELIGHKRLALAMNTRRLPDRTLVNDQGKKGAVELPDFDTHLVCHVGSSCEFFERAFERALDENPDIQKAVAALAAAEEPYQTARTAREGFWMKDPEYREMRDAVAEIEKDLRTLNVKTKEGRDREREKKRQLRELFAALDNWKIAWMKANPGEQDLGALKKAVDDAGKKLWYERKKRSELASRRAELVKRLAKYGVPNTEELDITYHVAGSGVVGHDRNVKLYELDEREHAFPTDMLGQPLSAGEDQEDVTVSFPISHIWEAFREENRNKLYRPGTHGYFVYAPQLPRHEWVPGAEAKPDTVKNLLLYGKIGNILIGRVQKTRDGNKEHVYGWALLLRKEQIVDIVISQDFYRNRFAAVPAVLLEAVTHVVPASRTIEKIAKSVDSDAGRAMLPHDMVRKLSESVPDEAELTLTLKGGDIRTLLGSLTLPSLVEQFAAISHDPYEKIREQERMDKKAERKEAKKAGRKEAVVASVAAKPGIPSDDAGPVTVAAVPHPSTTPPAEPDSSAEGSSSGGEETSPDKAEAASAGTSTPALN
ncbi:hypothetical protein KJZ71_02060 [Patescibacteria group bacterium]|uniref:Uncharacterized protein n=1 Tax=candidate division WWE3 bacterium TaxID=2053526 RepID=A0A928TS47_UNCKA|nr:hypothetical protein [candidate division WWE3 bacterium]MCL4732571.1 hypothetical protein [Patescibacteria group bacterium]MDL1953241.1 hypothetical protein [Candidatus Uhrbacteria bacterium UHB]RIL00952.1 MAG: hypothetical protein DCC77_00195 [Candidatus Uhrbacteria bacterium]